MRVLRIGRDAAALLRDEDGAVAVRASLVESLEELQLAYYLAERSFENRTNVAKKLKFEFLLWLAGKTDIRSAMEITAPKGAALAVVFADGAISRKLEKLGAKEARLKKAAEPLALEKISLSRLK